MELVVILAAYLGLAMLMWDCVEVGRNDAANLVNAVFGSRVMARRTAVMVAGVAVVLGAVFASPVMETVRRGIFDPTQLTLKAAIIVYISVYIVDTVLLYSLSAFGMPISTTASLVFELVGAALGVTLVTQGLGPAMEIVFWGKVGTVLLAIIISIILSGFAGFLLQRAARGALGQDISDERRLILHGPWVAGLILTSLTWFLLMKGMKSVSLVKTVREATLDAWGMAPFLVTLWFLYSMLVLVTLLTRPKTRVMLFPALAVLGMIAMAFAFGQNDLANAASPGLSAWWLYSHAPAGVEASTKLPISMWALFGCGLLMAFGMGTTNAQRVTRAEVNTGSQHDDVALWAPRWTRRLARLILREDHGGNDLTPPAAVDDRGKRMHYDTLRAAIITSVSASVIAFASSRGLPVSTTYVAFAAVIATGWGDRVFSTGQADRKLGRAIWVVTSWFLAGGLALVATAFVAAMIYQLEVWGLVAMLALNLAVRQYFKLRAERHEERYHLRIHPHGKKESQAPTAPA
jgi:phosphate/sulfate permease